MDLSLRLTCTGKYTVMGYHNGPQSKINMYVVVNSLESTQLAQNMACLCNCLLRNHPSFNCLTFCQSIISIKDNGK